MNEKYNEVWFSILICCYNSEKFIKETLDSVLKQTYKKYEIIIINDGSTDNTENIIKSFKKKNLNIKVKYLKTENTGLANARNKGIEISSHKWIALLDHDDIWLKNKLADQSSEIINNPGCNLFFSDFSYFGNNNNTTRFENSLKYENFKPYEINLSKDYGYNYLLTKGCFIGSSTCVFNQNKRNLPKFNKRYNFICDYDFFLEYSIYYNMFCSKNNYVKWRIHQNQSTQKMNNILTRDLKKFYINHIMKSKINIYIKSILLIKYLKLIIKKILINE